MNIMLLISIIAFVLGLVALLLVILNRFQNYRAGLIVGMILLFALSIGSFLIGQNSSPAVVSTPEQSVTPATSEETVSNELPNSPISPPTSPVATPAPAIVEGTISDIELTGCLLFISNRTDDLEIYKMETDPNSPQQLTDRSGLDIDAIWSPDGSKIAFASDRDPDIGFQIYTMNADGSDVQMVGPVQPGDNTHPSWSPDGSQIAYESKRDINGNAFDDNNDIYLMNSDGSNITLLVGDSSDDGGPSWSPDGSKIAFLSRRTGPDEIYLVNPDGTGVTQLTRLNTFKSGLKWTSDSQHLVFENDKDIYSLDIVSGVATPLLTSSDTNEATPVWIEDDRLLVLSSDRTGNWELYALLLSSPTESKLVQLTDDAGIDRSSSWSSCN